MEKLQYTDDGNANCHKISEHFGDAYLSNFISKNIFERYIPLKNDIHIRLIM